MLAFCNLWTLFGLGVFYFGPVDWPGAENPSVGLYVLACLLAFNLGYRVTRSADGALNSPGAIGVIPAPRTAGMARGIIATYAVLTFIYLFAITGRSVLAGDAYSFDFGQVYSDFAQASANRNTDLTQTIVVLAKAALFPFALIAFIAQFRKDKWVVIGFLGPMIISSLFRGTDKEIIDSVTLTLVAMSLHKLLSRRIWWLIIIAPTVVALFTARRISRFGGTLPACLPDSSVCFNYTSQIANWFGQNAEISAVFLTNYLTNGYQGLSHAFNLDWTFGYGIGHLRPLRSATCSALNVLCASDDYQSKLTAGGWDASNRWTSVYVPLANDFSFWLVPLYTFILGIAFARCLAAWKRHQDPFAAGGIALVILFWVYSSANMQIAISLDWTFATILLLYIAPWRGMKVRNRPEDASGKESPNRKRHKPRALI